MDDVRAVLDAAGAERAALLGHSEGGPMCLLFAATYPERTVALVLIGTYAQASGRARLPVRRRAPQAYDAFLREIADGWGGRRRARGTRAEPRRRHAVPDLVVGLPAHEREPGRGPRAHADERGDRRAAGARDDRRPDPRRAPHRRPIASGRGRSLPRGADPWREARRASRRRPPAVRRRPGRDPRRDRGVPDRRPPGRRAPIACWRRFSSPTSSARPSGRSELGDRAWRDLLDSHHLARAAGARALARRRGRHGRRRLPRDVRRPRAGDPLCAARSATRCAASGLEIRAGLHTGRVRGARRRRSRASPCTSARGCRRWPVPGEVLVSSTVRDLVAGSGIEFDERGEHELKGVPGRWRLYSVADA